MVAAGTVFECSRASRRLAEAQSIGELEKEWQTAQENFQKTWERKTNNKSHKLLMLVHDEYAGIDDKDVVQALATINSLDKNEPIDVILHTHGGFVSPTMQIAEVLVHRRRTATFVPIFAHSGGTMVALATQKIHMARGAALGPLDIQIRGPSFSGSARHIIEIAEKLGDDADIELQVAAKEAKLTLENHAKNVCAVMNRAHKGLFGWRGCELANTLTKGDMQHSEAINFAMAKRLHMRVARDIPKAVYALISVRLAQLRRLRELQKQVHYVEDQAAAGHTPESAAGQA